MTFSNIGIQKNGENKNLKTVVRIGNITLTYSAIYEEMVEKAKQFGLIAGHSLSVRKIVK